MTGDQETPLDLVDCDDYEMMALLMQTKLEVVKRKLSENIVGSKVIPAWVRRESLQEDVTNKKTQIDQNNIKMSNKTESVRTINEINIKTKEKESLKPCW